MINRLPPQFRVSEGGVLPASPLPRLDAGAGFGERLLDRTAACIGAYPTASLATALVAGLVIGRLVKSL